jgi:predicted SnoaL-like aldol condensation-catalyzing enzyme
LRRKKGRRGPVKASFEYEYIRVWEEAQGKEGLVDFFTNFKEALINSSMSIM